MITNGFPKEEIAILGFQIRKAALSVLLNISEGCSRKFPREKKRFFEISRSSLVEMDTGLELAAELGFVKPVELKDAGRLINEIFAMLTSMINKSE
jgi:four helix bundle protein